MSDSLEERDFICWWWWCFLLLGGDASAWGRVSLYLWSLSWNLLCRSDWPGTQRDPPVSVWDWRRAPPLPGLRRDIVKQADSSLSMDQSAAVRTSSYFSNWKGPTQPWDVLVQTPGQALANSSLSKTEDRVHSWWNVWWLFIVFFSSF